MHGKTGLCLAALPPSDENMIGRPASKFLLLAVCWLLASCDISTESTIRQRAIERDAKPATKQPHPVKAEPAKGALLK